MGQLIFALNTMGNLVEKKNYFTRIGMSIFTLAYVLLLTEPRVKFIQYGGGPFFKYIILMQHLVALFQLCIFKPLLRSTYILIRYKPNRRLELGETV
jgi:hypothetical protein